MLLFGVVAVSRLFLLMLWMVVGAIVGRWALFLFVDVCCLLLVVFTGWCLFVDVQCRCLLLFVAGVGGRRCRVWVLLFANVVVFSVLLLS